MNPDDLISDCLNYAFDHEISYHVMSFPVKSDPSMVFVKHRIMIINRNYINQRQLPFQICHEIAHILNDDDFDIRDFGDYIVSVNMEYSADILALQILIPMYLRYVDYYGDNTVMPIMRVLDIPFNLINAVVHIAKPLIIPMIM